MTGKPSNDPTHVDYVPSLFAFTPSLQKKSLQKRAQKHKDVSEMKRRRLEAQNRSPHCDEVSPEFIRVCDSQDAITSDDVVAQLRSTDQEITHLSPEAELSLLREKLANEQQKRIEAESQVTQLQKELDDTKQRLQRAESQVDVLQKKVHDLERLKRPDLTQNSLKDNPKMVQFYTGLPSFATLMIVFNLALNTLPSVRTHGNRKLSNFTEFLLTLIKLRLDLRNKDLSYRFGVSESFVSLTVHKWLNILYTSLRFLIHWPSREEVRATLPECFRPKFLNAVVIIDCTEVFIERASNLLARSQTWSTYKSHNTIKYLIGVTPQGSISFVSKAWGGRVSDKVLTQECGILNKLLPGDLVLADRGFNIFELVTEFQAQAELPVFTKGKSQLPEKEIKESRELAHVRIHVERLIGMVKQKYSILEGVMPISFIKHDSECDVSVADKVMVICCALVNICESIVPKD